MHSLPLTQKRYYNMYTVLEFQLIRQNYPPNEHKHTHTHKNSLLNKSQHTVMGLWAMYVVHHTITKMNNTVGRTHAYTSMHMHIRTWTRTPSGQHTPAEQTIQQQRLPKTASDANSPIFLISKQHTIAAALHTVRSSLLNLYAVRQVCGFSMWVAARLFLVIEQTAWCTRMGPS